MRCCCALLAQLVGDDADQGRHGVVPRRGQAIHRRAARVVVPSVLQQLDERCDHRVVARRAATAEGIPGTDTLQLT